MKWIVVSRDKGRACGKIHIRIFSGLRFDVVIVVDAGRSGYLAPSQPASRFRNPSTGHPKRPPRRTARARPLDAPFSLMHTILITFISPGKPCNRLRNAFRSPLQQVQDLRHACIGLRHVRNEREHRRNGPRSVRNKPRHVRNGAQHVCSAPQHGCNGLRKARNGLLSIELTPHGHSWTLIMIQNLPDIIRLYLNQVSSSVSMSVHEGLKNVFLKPLSTFDY
ncbi:hypothetical protein OpiT1DRAFT_05362 [Opitutaceae bacterium TAV1]|nr:hypothetical protein OpiT1DRAFT_05362 [Opitutaceae bacterium TAV1]